MENLAEKRVLIVGGSSGIGAASARAFAARGALITIASRNQSKLDFAANEIGGDIVTAILDTTDETSIESFFANANSFDHIVVSAAETASGPIGQLVLAEAYASMNSKFWGAYRIAKAAKITDGGSLTLVSGFLSIRPSKSSVLQGAINAALEALARGLALELSPVRVNTVSPGLVATSLWSKLNNEARQAMFEAAAARLPARCVGQPEDVANAVVYLATTPYATGSTVVVDGGGSIA
ncbi:short chain dehydrogenase [Caballeronia sordidicola]|uniref:Short chain dehydrogenase n=1 Tax=Caballeronia sordidicola TaxID=196367 RepID=A0A158GX97_CABSO|nr:SDR family oxidoreductase [Caballeronia sordidicola]SAL36229.1 short chain dehydrogenase [Caballeronia sordidicola]